MKEKSIAKRKYCQLLDRIVNDGKISHAYLIEIDDYDTDFSYVLTFIKLILCKKSKKNSDNVDCNDCNICKQIDSNVYVDLKIIEPDGTIIKKGQLLNLQEEFRNKSFLNNKMIYIIKEADKLNDSSANTILKFLEEPEDNIIAILVTTNRYRVLDTILSRCQIISIQDSNYQTTFSEKSTELLKFIINKDDLFINYQYIFNNILPDKSIANNVLLEVEDTIICYLNYVANNDMFCDDNIIKLLSKIDNNILVNYISLIEDELSKLEYNVNYKLWLDCLFAKLIGG